MKIGIKKQNFVIIGGVIFLLIGVFIYFYPQVIQQTKLTQSDLTDVIITLERTPCYGRCPVYKLTIYGNGTVLYDGNRYVNITEKQTSYISLDKIRELVDEFYKIDYFSLSDRYDAPVTDLPTKITSITIAGKTKQVVNYYGAPEKLTELENKIDEITNSKIWVKVE